MSRRYTYSTLLIIFISIAGSALMAQENKPGDKPENKVENKAEAAAVAAAPPATASATAPAAPERVLVTISDVDFKHLSLSPQLNWGFNPFLRKPGYALIDLTNDVLSPDKFVLGAIIYDKEGPLAIVNDRTVGVGDRIEGLEIEEIASNYITLRGQGLHFELTLPPARETASSAEIEPSTQPPKKETNK
jgi:hypothetical protein